MKKTYSQFVVVLAGVLLLHLVAATALMKSAQEDTAISGLKASSPDPYYHSNPSSSEPEQSPGWGTAETPEETAVSGKPPRSLPAAFADATQAPEPDAETVEAEILTEAPAPLSKHLPALKKIAPSPAPEPAAPTRRLTVTQLLTPDPPVAEKNETESATAEHSSAAAGPKVRPLPAAETNSGPRKIRSLSGN